MKRPLLLACAIGALAALVPSTPSTAEPLGPAAPLPAGNISPELNNIPVDGLEYRVVKQQYDATSAALSNAKNVLASSATELTNLQLDDTRLTNQLAQQTDLKKEATIERASARAGLRALAINTYVTSRRPRSSP